MYVCEPHSNRTTRDTCSPVGRCNFANNETNAANGLTSNRLRLVVSTCPAAFHRSDYMWFPAIAILLWNNPLVLLFAVCARLPAPQAPHCLRRLDRASHFVPSPSSSFGRRSSHWSKRRGAQFARMHLRKWIASTETKTWTMGIMSWKETEKDEEKRDYSRAIHIHVVFINIGK